ncbi:MAG: hypothetical protein F4Z04_15760 [Acidobacteria bacterium]|nr:hypothetical protein [Acidobacteriota bacterium]
MAHAALHFAVAVLLALLPSVRALCVDSCLELPAQPARTEDPACHGAQQNGSGTHHPEAPGSETGCDHDDVSRARPAAKIGPDRVDTLAAVMPTVPQVVGVPLALPVITDPAPSPALDFGGFLTPLRC